MLPEIPDQLPVLLGQTTILSMTQMKLCWVIHNLLYHIELELILAIELVMPICLLQPSVYITMALMVDVLPIRMGMISMVIELVWICCMFQKVQVN